MRTQQPYADHCSVGCLKAPDNRSVTKRSLQNYKKTNNYNQLTNYNNYNYQTKKLQKITTLTTQRRAKFATTCSTTTSRRVPVI